MEMGTMERALLLAQKPGDLPSVIPDLTRHGRITA